MITEQYSKLNKESEKQVEDKPAENIVMKVEKKKYKTIKKKNTFCLNMIVRNESKVILRCLESTLPIIDYWIISDTGSTDGTQQLIKDFFKKHNIPGKLYEDKWCDFGYNRTLSLKYVKEYEKSNENIKIDYILVIDADELFEYDYDLNEIPELLLDRYYITTKYGNLQYERVQLVSNRLNWSYKGVLHEYIDCPEANGVGHIKGIYDRPRPDGSRSSNPKKYEKDAAIFELALFDKPNNPRYMFYLAQSYRDAKNMDKAIENYKKRADMGNFSEEVYYSLYQVGVCMLRRGDNYLECLGYLLKAYNYRRTRLEALYYFVKYCNINKMHQIGYSVAKHLVVPNDKICTNINDRLFVEIDIYNYKLHDELSIAAYWSGDYKISSDLAQKVIDCQTAPESYKVHVIRNKKYSDAKLKMVDKVNKNGEIDNLLKTNIDNNLTNDDIANIWNKPVESNKNNFQVKIAQKITESLNKLDINYDKIIVDKNIINNFGQFNIGIVIHCTKDNMKYNSNILNFLSMSMNDPTMLLLFIIDSDVDENSQNNVLQFTLSTCTILKILLKKENKTKYDSVLNNVILNGFKYIKEFGCDYMTAIDLEMLPTPDWILNLQNIIDDIDIENIVVSGINNNNTQDKKLLKNEIVKRHLFAKTSSLDYLLTQKNADDMKIACVMNSVLCCLMGHQLLVDTLDNFSIEYLNYRFYPCFDSNGGDIKSVQNIDLSRIIEMCNALGAKGFNTNGYIKGLIRPREEWSKYDFNILNGLFVKID